MKNATVQKLGILFVFLLAGCVAAHAQGQCNTYYNHAESRNPCKVFIGVGTSSVAGGLKVDYTVDNTPATTYGIKAGDVILTLDGVSVRTQSDLLTGRNKHQQGDAFTLGILRDGREITIKARFKECSEAEMTQANEQPLERKMERMKKMEMHMDEVFANTDGLQKIEKKERPILGIYEADEEAGKEGLAIGSVIRGKGAEAAGLQKGDVITMVNGKKIGGTGTLRAALAGQKAGDRVAVVYQRNGQMVQTEVALSADRTSYSYTVERDPCAVFIGVFTSDRGADGRGVKVTGIVDDTPAKQSGVQVGDVILSLDGQPINTQSELLRERNKHQPGDLFRLTILREGASVNIDARFKTCQTPEKVKQPVKEVVELASEETTQPRETPKATELSLESLELFPNPTAGPLNIRFEGEAVPTTVRIMDVSGKAVYSKTLQQFTGYFNETVELFGNTPGNYILTIQQGEQAISRKVVLMPRA